MATEKILNTRIQLKYDSFTNWSTNNPTLKSGEVAIAYLGNTVDTTEVTPNNNTHPVMFKVGPGEFNSLPWASALAADVYSWAKASDVVLEGKTIKFVGTNKSITLNYITESEAQTLINTALGDYSTTEQMNAAIEVEKNRAEGIEAGFKTRIETLEAAVGKDGSVATQIQGAIEALDSSASQTAGADGLALGVTLVDGKVTSITGSIAAETYDAFGAAATAKTEAIADAKTETEKQVNALADGQVKTNKEAIEAINAAETGILAQAKAYADDIKDNILGEGIKDTFDTLVEIQEWIEDDGVNTTELTAAIADETKNRKEAISGVQDQIDALGITDGKVSNATTADVANSLSETAKAEVKAVKVDNATNADNAADSAKLGGVVAANYLLKNEAPGYDDILTKTVASTTYQPKGDYATAAQGALADSALQKADITTGSANGTIAIEGTDVAVKGLGSAAYTETSAYATAEQGTKADSALQEIKTTANGGLKVTNKNQIDIDTDVVFVFNCGSSTELVD